MQNVSMDFDYYFYGFALWKQSSKCLTAPSRRLSATYNIMIGTNHEELA